MISLFFFFGQISLHGGGVDYGELPHGMPTVQLHQLDTRPVSQWPSKNPRGFLKQFRTVDPFFVVIHNIYHLEMTNIAIENGNS